MIVHLATDPTRRALMQRVRRSGTPAEEQIATLCRKLGLAYRRNVRSLPGSPDLANKSLRWAVFVNGCFWHHHTGCANATVPKRNRAFWTAKLEGNRRRDAKKIRQLRSAGYRVLLLWACKIDEEAEVLRRLSHLSKARIVDPT
jgi:DNA mismatch endonuclease (patch repair protein)